MDFDFLKDCVGKVGVELTRENCESLARYYEMVVEKNKAFNLTAITEEKDFAIKHIADSLAGISEIPQNAMLLDIGAGAGFPSMPIAIVRRDVSVTALDSTAKKMNFISECARELKIDNIKTIAGRAEEQRNLFSQFDVVTARAVSALNILLELAMPLLKVGGRFVAYKTDESELGSAKSALETLGAKHVSTKSLSLPNGDSRAIMVFKKSCLPQSNIRDFTVQSRKSRCKKLILYSTKTLSMQFM